MSGANLCETIVFVVVTGYVLMLLRPLHVFLLFLLTMVLNVTNCTRPQLFIMVINRLSRTLYISTPQLLFNPRWVFRRSSKLASCSSHGLCSRFSGCTRHLRYPPRGLPASCVLVSPPRDSNKKLAKYRRIGVDFNPLFSLVGVAVLPTCHGVTRIAVSSFAFWPTVLQDTLSRPRIRLLSCKI